jgi:hypothetical protein
MKIIKRSGDDNAINGHSDVPWENNHFINFDYLYEMI